MATPALRVLRRELAGTFIGGLVRPGIDEVLAGTGLLDEVHVEPAAGMMGPKRAAARVRMRRYDAALLLTNSFSSALTARLAGIPRRIGYSRDGRGLLLTDRLEPPRRADGRWAPVSAVAYYLNAARAVLGEEPGDFVVSAWARMELAVTEEEEHAGAEVLARCGVERGAALAMLNPGGNNAVKRWPAERFAEVGAHLVSRHGMAVLVNGSPGERELVEEIVRGIGQRLEEHRFRQAETGGTFSLAGAGVTLGSLKAIVRGCRVMVTNDTGPRHFAAALGVPVVSLFGPTDPRWTTIVAPAGEAVLAARDGLAEEEVSDDHPERCRVEQIGVESVTAAVDRLLVGQ